MLDAGDQSTSGPIEFTLRKEPPVSTGWALELGWTVLEKQTLALAWVQDFT